MTKKKSNIKTKFSSAILTTLAVLLISIVGVYFAIKNLNYGLDLQGGFEIVYEVSPLDGKDAIPEMTAVSKSTPSSSANAPKTACEQL